jgi:Protein of unknown function (DUF1573)
MFGRPFHRSRTRARLGGAVLLFACGLALLGCGRTRPSPEVQARLGEGKPTRVLEADVGLLRHGQKVRRRFTITNDSGSKWTLARLHNDCACTAGRPLTEEVSPGASMEVDVDYVARPFNVDDRRRVGIEFAEAAAPFVWLEIRACIRAPISVFPPRPTIVPARQDNPESSFEIHNCTGHDVRLLCVRSSTPWLTARPPVPIARGDQAWARQIWRVVVEAKTDGLPVGRHQAQIDIQTDCPEAPVTPVVLDLDLRGPVEASPGQLAFGAISPGARAKRRVLLRYATEGTPPGHPHVSLSHNLGEQLQVSYAATSATVGELSAVLTPSKKAAGGELRGLVVVTFGGSDLLPLEIPVSATVQQP